MNYLSIDIEATGLNENDYIIEFALVPFSVKDNKIYNDLCFHRYLKCPSFEILEPNLNDWVVDHNENLIRKASAEGITTLAFKKDLQDFLERDNRLFK